MFPVVRQFLVSTTKSIVPVSRSLVGTCSTLPTSHNEGSVMGAVSRLEKEKATLTAKVARLETENIKLHTENKELREKLDMLQDKCDIVVDKDYASRIVKLEKENEALREENDVLRTWVSNLDKKVSSLNNQVAGMERDIKTLRGVLVKTESVLDIREMCLEIEQQIFKTVLQAPALFVDFKDILNAVKHQRDPNHIDACNVLSGVSQDYVWVAEFALYGSFLKELKKIGDQHAQSGRPKDHKDAIAKIITAIQAKQASTKDQFIDWLKGVYLKGT